MEVDAAPEQLMVQFRTKTYPLATTDSPFSVPSTLGRYGLSELVNHLLSLDPVVPFDFLVSGKRLLRGTLAEVLASEWAQGEGLSAENTILLEYFEALRPPVNDWNVKEDDWIGAVCGALPGVVVSGGYDERIRVYSDAGQVLFESRELGGPVSDIQVCGGVRGEESPLLAVATKEEGFRTYWLRGGEQAKQKGRKSKKAQEYELVPHCVFQGHSQSVECLASHPSQPRVVSGSWDGTVGLWKIEEEDVSREGEDQEQEGAEGASSSSGGRKGGRPRQKRAKKTASLSSHGINTSMDALKGHTQVVSGVHWQDDMRIASCSWDQRIICYDAYMGEMARDMKSDSAIFHITSVPGHPHLLLTSHQDPVIRLWDDRTEEGAVVTVRFQGHTEWVPRSLFCPGSQHTFASAGYDRSVRFWDTRSTKPVFTLSSCHKQRVLALDWHGSRSVVSGGADKFVRVHSSNSSDAHGGASSSLST